MLLGSRGQPIQPNLLKAPPTNFSVIQSAKNTVSSGNGTVTYASNLSSGTKLICVVSVSVPGGTEPVSSVKDTAGNSLTRLLSRQSAAGDGWVELWAMDTPAGDAGSVTTLTATIGPANFGVTMVAQEVSGLLAGNTTAMLDGTGSTNTATSTGPATTSAYSTSAPNEYLVAIAGDAGYSVTYTNSPGYTPDPKEVNASSSATAMLNYDSSSGTSESASFALGASAGWVTLIVAFKLASANAPVSITGSVSASSVTAIAGTLGGSFINGSAAVSSVIAIAGTIFISITGSSGNISAAAIPGRLSSGPVSGVTAANSVSAIPGSAASGPIPGSAATGSITASAGTILITVPGAISSSSVSAPSGTVKITVPGQPGTVGVAAIAGSFTASGSNINVTGVVASSSVSAIPGSIPQSLTGITGAISGFAIPGSSRIIIPGQAGIVSVSAISGSVIAGQSDITIIGSAANVNITAIPGDVQIHPVTITLIQGNVSKNLPLILESGSIIKITENNADRGVKLLIPVWKRKL